MRETGIVLLLLICVVVLCSCANVSPVLTCSPTCPQLAEPPAWVMEQQDADFGVKMRNFLFQKPDGPTGS